MAWQQFQAEICTVSSAQKPMIERLRVARVLAAEMVLLDPGYVCIFERIERELAALERQDDALARASVILAISQG